jgi:hypothetical protein
MKSQMSKPRHGREKYSEEYKQQALELWRQSGRSANLVVAELGGRAVRGQAADLQICE